MLSKYFSSEFFGVSFGELDISPTIVSILVFITVFVFLAVIISTITLIKSLVKD